MGHASPAYFLAAHLAASESYQHQALTVAGRSTAKKGDEQQRESDEHRDRAVNSPTRLAGHRAAEENVDALQKPNSSRHEEEDADDDQDPAHT